jgi:hypothetical protein
MLRRLFVGVCAFVCGWCKKSLTLIIKYIPISSSVIISLPNFKRRFSTTMSIRMINMKAVVYLNKTTLPLVVVPVLVDTFILSYINSSEWE